MAEAAWRLVQDRPQPLQLGSAKDRRCTPRPRGDGHEAGHTLSIEGADAVPHRLDSATQASGDFPRPASLSAQEHDLRAPHGERVRGTQARLEPGPLLSARLADVDRWMHAQQMRSSIRSHKRSGEDALGRPSSSPACWRRSASELPTLTSSPSLPPPARHPLSPARCERHRAGSGRHRLAPRSKRRT